MDASKLEALAAAVLADYLQAGIADADVAQVIQSSNTYADYAAEVSDDNWDKLKDLVNTAVVEIVVGWRE